MTWKARIEWVSIETGMQGISKVFAVETLTGASSTVVSTSPAPNFGGKVRGNARITMLAGAALLGIGDDTPTETDAARLELGHDPYLASVVAGQVLSFIEATDGPAAAGTVALTGGTTLGLVAGEAHIGEVGGRTVVKSVALTLDTAAYAAGDLLADTQVVAAAFRKNDGTGLLQSLMVIDQDDQKPAMTVYFLDANNTFGAENAAPSISDASALAILGSVDIVAGDYKDLGGVSVACIKSIGLPIKAVSGVDTLYVAAVLTAGTPTHTATGVTLRLGILQD